MAGHQQNKQPSQASITTHKQNKKNNKRIFINEKMTNDDVMRRRGVTNDDDHFQSPGIKPLPPMRGMVVVKGRHIISEEFNLQGRAKLMELS